MDELFDVSDLINERFGEPGTPSRIEVEKKAQAFLAKIKEEDNNKIDAEKKTFTEIEEASKDLKLNQRRCPKCKEVVTSYCNVVFCSCGYIGVDAGSMFPDGSFVRTLVHYDTKSDIHSRISPFVKYQFI